MHSFSTQYAEQTYCKYQNSLLGILLGAVFVESSRLSWFLSNKTPNEQDIY